MSLLYFSPRLPTATDTGLPAREVDAANKVVEKSQIASGAASKKPRRDTIFSARDRAMIGRFAAEHGNIAAVK